MCVFVTTSVGRVVSADGTIDCGEKCSTLIDPSAQRYLLDVPNDPNSLLTGVSIEGLGIRLLLQGVNVDVLDRTLLGLSRNTDAGRSSGTIRFEFQPLENNLAFISPVDVSPLLGSALAYEKSPES